MSVRVLVMQRKNQYPGEHAPEVLAVVDQWTLDENSEWWTNEIARQKNLIGTDADAWAEIEIDLPRDQIEAALYPSTKVQPTSVRVVAEPDEDEDE